MKTDKIKEAKELLKSEGFFVDNLWHIDDVSEYKCNNEEALEVLEQALTNEATMEQIWFAIHFHAVENGHERK